MTHAEKLREYLISNGFSIIGETILKEDKIYQIICAEYSGAVSDYSELELIFGRHNLEKRSEVFLEYARYVRSVFVTRKDGKSSAGADVSNEENLISQIDKIIND